MTYQSKLMIHCTILLTLLLGCNTSDTIKMTKTPNLERISKLFPYRWSNEDVWLEIYDEYGFNDKCTNQRIVFNPEKLPPSRFDSWKTLPILQTDLERIKDIRAHALWLEKPLNLRQYPFEANNDIRLNMET